MQEVPLPGLEFFMRSIALAVLLTSALGYMSGDETPKAKPPVVKFTTAEAIARLDMDADLTVSIKGTSFELLCQHLSKVTELTFSVDEAWFQSIGYENIAEKQFRYNSSPGTSVRTALKAMCAQLSVTTPLEQGSSAVTVGYTVMGNLVVIGQGHESFGLPLEFSRLDEGWRNFLPLESISRQLYGPTVSFSVKNRPLADVVDLLRDQCGANIVLIVDEATKKKPITLMLNDVKLFTALRTIAELSETGAANAENVFYVTTPEKAAILNAATADAIQGKAAKK